MPLETKRVGVFWNYSSSPILDGHSVFDAATRLRKHAAGEAVDIGTYKAYADMRDTPKETRQELQFAGAGLVDAPDGQDALIMTADLVLYALSGPPSDTTIFVVSRTQSLHYPLSMLRLRGYNVVIITSDSGDSNSDSIISSIASRVISWEDVFGHPASTTDNQQLKPQANASSAKSPPPPIPGGYWDTDSAHESPAPTPKPTPKPMSRISPILAPKALADCPGPFPSNDWEGPPSRLSWATIARPAVSPLLPKPQPMVPISSTSQPQNVRTGFRPLVDILNRLRRDGVDRPLYADVSAHWKAFAPMFSAAGVEGVNEYLRAASTAKGTEEPIISIHSGKGIRHSIELNEPYISNVPYISSGWA